MNKNLNLEDVQKFTKYYLKMGALTGGANSASGAKSKKLIYDQKMDEYTTKLQKSGVDTNQVIKIIQSGGNPLDELKKMKEMAENAIGELKGNEGNPNYEDINKSVGEITDKMNEVVRKHLVLKEKYSEYYSESQKAFVDLVKSANAKATQNAEDVKVGIPQSLTELSDMLSGNYLDEDIDVKMITKDMTLELHTSTMIQLSTVPQEKRAKKVDEEITRLEQSLNTIFDNNESTMKSELSLKIKNTLLLADKNQEKYGNVQKLFPRFVLLDIPN